MDSAISIDTTALARQLAAPIESIETVVRLLAEGNTTPYLARYRRDEIGNLDESQIVQIKTRVDRQRALDNRKEVILRAIKSRGKLDERLETEILKTHSPKVLEDLYLPFKIKKQSTRDADRDQNLAPLAAAILAPDVSKPLDELAQPFVDVGKGITTVEQAINGARELIEEQFNHHIELRRSLRRIVRRTGVLVSKHIEDPADSTPTAHVDKKAGDKEAGDKNASEKPVADAKPVAKNQSSETAGDRTTSGDDVSSTKTESTVKDRQPVVGQPVVEQPAVEQPLVEQPKDKCAVGSQEPSPSGDSPAVSDPDAPADSDGIAKDVESVATAVPSESTVTDACVSQDTTAPTLVSTSTAAPVTNSPQTNSTETDTEPTAVAAADSEPGAASSPLSGPKRDASAKRTSRVTASGISLSKEARRQIRREARHRKRKKLESSFTDYFDFHQSISKIREHRILAIDRGERFRVLDVQLTVDNDAITKEAESILVPTNHPRADVLRDYVKSALSRLIIPSLQRDLRRDLTERAESHAIRAISNNLRKLLLRRPVRQRILAIAPTTEPAVVWQCSTKWGTP